MNTNLPVYQKREEIVNAVETHDTVIITAETGSGKSTQIPQYLFDAGYEVIVTQPRRLACVSLAERVAEEMRDPSWSKWKEGLVAYHTAFESTKTQNTKILFCTDGLQMAKGIKDNRNTVLILDEVHEWNLNIETLVAWIKKFRMDGGYLKVVLMSATIDTEDLLKYYEDSIFSVKCINISGRTYDVEKIHKSEMSFIDMITEYASKGKNVLAFCPGKKEISDTINKLSNFQNVFPLHGDLSYEDQRKCFKHYSSSKIVVATNVAQTSVTIDDIDVVVDLGTEKRVEVNNGIEGLFIHNISTADCLQRAGRAGRTKDGIYVLCSNHNLYYDREEYSTPEIQRLALDKVVLKLLSVGIDAETLDFYHQPKRQSIFDAKRLLTILGAIKDGEITETGKEIVKMPVSTRFAKMIIEAQKRKCVADIITAVSCMEIGSLISTRKKKMLWIDVNWEYGDFTKETRSDVLAEIDIYTNCVNFKYKDLSESGINKKNFFRIKELHKKLEELLSYNYDVNLHASNRLDIVKCIASGLLDQLYYNDGYECCKNHESFKLSRGSVLQNHLSYRFVFGLPKTITFKDRFGWDRSMNILTMCSGFTDEELLDFIGIDNVKKVIDTNNIDYDLDEEAFTIPVTLVYDNLTIKSYTENISKGDENFVKYMQEYKDVFDRAQRKRLTIGSSVYNIVYEYHYSYGFGDIPCIHLSVSEKSSNEILSSDIDYWMDPNDEKVLWIYGYIMDKNLDVIRGHIRSRRYMREYQNESIERQISKPSAFTDQMIDYASLHPDSYRGNGHSLKTMVKDDKNNRKKEMKEKIPTDHSSDPKEISEFLNKISSIDFDYPEFNMTGTKYIGCDFDSGEIKLKLFDDEIERNDKTIESLQKYVIKRRRDLYGDNNFIIRRAGRKFETDDSKAAREEFHELSDLLIQELTVDNFESSISLMDEFYNDAINSCYLLSS